MVYREFLIRILILILSTLIAYSYGYVEPNDMKVCIGTRSRLSVIRDRVHHYRNLRDRFTNCTYVDGNLELTWLQDKKLDLSFLQHIREVTGYVLISHVDIEKIVLPRLQIIRGLTLFNLNAQDDKFSLFVTYSQMQTLEMPALRDILKGSVGFYSNWNLCFIKNGIDWDEIITGQNATFQYKYNTDAPDHKCPKCDKSCEKGCWGAGPHNCQKFSKVNCSPQCAQGRCFGPEPRQCCHLFCAGGCTGPTQKDCLACKNFYDDGVCKEECPPMQKYNPTKYIWEPNPEGKYAYGATCVRNCPEHLLKDNGACVRTCPLDKTAKNGDCVPCYGPCPKTCSVTGVIDSGNIDSFKGCTIIDGSIRILDQSFAGYQDYVNFSFGKHYPKMHPDRLQVFSTVKEITGYMDIQGEHPDFKNLSYFRNLEIIHGRQLTENYFASFSIVKSSIQSLELKSLRLIKSGAILIQDNLKLCFAENIDWSRIKKSTESHATIVLKNRKPEECRKDNLICSKECNEAGCWGAGPDQCLECKNFIFNGTCLSDCKMISNAYQFDSKTCKTCHPECKSCTGPGPDNCTECVHVKDEHVCAPQCSNSKYADNGICKPCHETCDGCRGPRNTIAPDGCITCDKAIINGDASIERCLKKGESCPDGYYYEYVAPQEGPLEPLKGKAICRKCHPRCERCTSYGFHEKVCQKCVGYKRGEQCEDECPIDHYADEANRECYPCDSECKGCFGPGPNNCFACRDLKIYNGDPADNSTTFNCTLTCPPTHPYKELLSDGNGLYCSDKRPIGSRLKSAMPIFLIIILVFLFVVLCILGAIAYTCRQKTKAKKEAVKITKVLAGCEDSEPLRPSNVGPNLTKLRIVKEAELRKGGVLGMGAFGRVYKGVWVPEGENIKIPVAIKELINVTGFESSKEFLEEAYIMASVEHPNVLKLLAVCMTSQMMLVTQLMPLGCLLDYVRNNTDKIGSKALLNWSTQIARGMSYLEERRLVHRDLAARNVLVQTPSCVKITDFGLAKLLSTESNEYRAVGGKMPIKWLALECIKNRVYTSKSDVWAFGVTIWELLTFGQRPYDETAAKDLPALIENGVKLEQPKICSLDVYCSLLSCWHLDADLRPTFKQLASDFAEYARDPGRYLNIPGDKFTRLPSYTTQDEKDLIRKLSPPFSSLDPIVETEDDIPLNVISSPIRQSIDSQFPRVIVITKSKTSSSDDETDFNTREIGVGSVRLKLPVDEQDYLMPTCQTPTNNNNNNNNKNNNNNNNKAPPNDGYMELIAVPTDIDNPLYLMNSNGESSEAASKSAISIVADISMPSQAIGIPITTPKENDNSNSDHEYYNDLQRELQPLHRNETRV